MFSLVVIITNIDHVAYLFVPLGLESLFPPQVQLPVILESQDHKGQVTYSNNIRYFSILWPVNNYFSFVFRLTSETPS